MADAAEGADAGADESEVDYDALPFNDTRYWTHFYDEDEPAFYDWYSAEAWLPQAVEAEAKRLRAACGKEQLDALDVGCGVSPLLFALADGNPGGWGDLHGVDFAEGAVQFCAAAAGRHPHGGLRFTVGDALALEACAPDSCADVVVDKGCLDCFVSGAGEADVGRYLDQLARVVRKPHGRVLILAVNGADVPHLLLTGEIRADPHCASSSVARRAGAWGDAKRARQVPQEGGQRLWLVETVACAEKHVLVLAPQPPASEAHVAPLRCHECKRRHACGVGPATPEKCACGCKLRRFALS